VTNCRAEERPSICNDEWSRAVADEYGFVISPKIASEYRDAKLLLQKLKELQWIDQTGKRSASRQGSVTPSGDIQKS